MTLTWALSALTKRTTRWRCVLAKEGNSPFLALNHPKCRSKFKTSLLSNKLSQDRKISPTFTFQEQTPICTTLKTNSSVLMNFFSPMESGYKLENHGQKCQLRKLLLARAASAPTELPPHTLLSAFLSSVYHQHPSGSPSQEPNRRHKQMHLAEKIKWIWI